MSKKSDEKLYANLNKFEEMIMEKALLDAQIAVLKLKSERLEVDITDFEHEYLTGYQTPDYTGVMTIIERLTQ